MSFAHNMRTFVKTVRSKMPKMMEDSAKAEFIFDVYREFDGYIMHIFTVCFIALLVSFVRDLRRIGV